MQKALLLLSIVIILVSCAQTQTSGDQKHTSDSLLNEDEVTPDIKKLRKEYVLSYSKPKEFDTICNPQHLKRYSIIFKPVFEGYNNSNDSIDFSFSISIPITDLGTSMKLSIKRNGQIIVGDPE